MPVEATEKSLPTVRRTTPLKALAPAALPPEAAEDPYQPEAAEEPFPPEVTGGSLSAEATELPALDASLRQVNIYNFQNFASC